MVLYKGGGGGLLDKGVGIVGLGYCSDETMVWWDNGRG